ncbi:Bug family tripartite tricarboxylate transporter substrate binding protein [Telluria aromaticivorans]|uniref:Tripartite tricarboxylate transporter substrate binding protein n=1 Tax=Telluria aromaticivorans TaxID=2725995 RepID=A0A7Y2NXY5_9BURK|nr:tripartite tricarboxylate transporter substrate binding protein [Telluria aromaticivorans]NNG21414.1 tripartite tricarboxylate transporter substrate binding protein [Telluria aromaticivorans]
MRLFFGTGKKLAFAVTASVISLGALAQNWPDATVTVVVPWPPGGPSDIAARPMAKGLTQALGQTFVIDNRAGGGGNIGTAAVTRAQGDGKTLLITSSAPIVINPSLYKNMNFDPLKDLAPVTNLLRVPLVLVAHPGVPAKNLKELMAHIQSKKGQFSFGSSGNGTPQHLTSELFASVAKLQMTHVPYKGSAPAISDLLGGHIPIMFDSTIAIMPHIKSGKVKAIAISGAKRSPLLPDVPTFAEAGLAGIESYAWYGMFAPAKTPKAVVAKINAEAIKVMKGPEFQKVLADTGSDFVGESPENFGKFVQAESVRWSKVVKDSGATVD